MGKVINFSKNKYKIVLIKTIDHEEPIYYRIVNLGSYDTIDIPAYRFLDEIINNRYEVTNLKLRRNSVHIMDNDNYEGLADVIMIDEFDEVPDMYTYAMKVGQLGRDLIGRFDANNNKGTMSSYKVDSYEKLAWTCDEGHTIYSGFAVYLGTHCACPICDAKRNNQVLSLNYWSKLTNSYDVLNAYENAGHLNSKPSKEIAWNSTKVVKLKLGDKIVEDTLRNITKQKSDKG